MNPRKNDEAAESLAKLMGEYGFVIPIIATPDGTVRAGHTRIKAARRQGMAEVPVIYVDFGDEKKAVSFGIADNKSHEWSEWAFPKLKDIFVELDDGSFDMNLTGFKEDELKEIFEVVGNGGNGDGLVPEKDPNIIARVSFHPGLWLGKREEIMKIFERMEKTYDCKIKVEE